jgi:hypothetical protein
MIADVLRRQLDEFIELRTLNFIEQPARVNRWNIRG